MESRNTSLEPVAYAYQASVAMPAVGIRATDWIVCRSTNIATRGDLIVARFRGSVVAGRLLRSEGGRYLFCDGKCHPIAKSDELQVLGIVIAVRGEHAFH